MLEFHADTLTAIFEQCADAIIFVDTAGIVRLWNRAATSMFGFAAEQVVGASMELIIPEKLRAAHWTGFRRAMETGTTRLNGRPTMTRATHMSGARLYVEMTFAVVRASDGTVLGSVAVARDATERYEKSKSRGDAT